MLLQGIHAILVADPSMQEAVLELLLPHFTQFVQTEAPCLKLDACVNAQVEIATESYVLTSCVSL